MSQHADRSQGGRKDHLLSTSAQLQLAENLLFYFYVVLNIILQPKITIPKVPVFFFYEMHTKANGS